MANHLLITARRDGFRRLGIAHPATPTYHPRSRFSEAQVTALKAEPMLVVVEADPPETEDGGQKAGDGKRK